MSTFTHESMINHHGQSFLNQLAELIRVWRQRTAHRRELAQWSNRELHDIGVSSGDALYEVSKPFWRA